MNDVTAEVCLGRVTWTGLAAILACFGLLLVASFSPQKSPSNTIYLATADIGPDPYHASLNAVPTAPILDPATSPTSDNPYQITGSADPLAEIIVYLNNDAYLIVDADGNGDFSADLALLDGINTVYATAWDDVDGESAPSNTINIDYVNNLPRSQCGTLTQDTVWTVGTSGAYLLDCDITVPAGVTFTLQRGVEVLVTGNYRVQVLGDMFVHGIDTAAVSLESGQSSPGNQDWQGIDVQSGGFLHMDFGDIRHAGAALDITGGGDAIVANTRLTGNSTAVWIGSGSSPTIGPGNEITNNAYGFYVYGDNDAGSIPQPVANGNAIHTNTTANVYALAFANPGGTVLDFTGNWWGTTDPLAIETKIWDRNETTGGANRPWIDWSGYLDMAGGTPVSGNATLVGNFLQDTTLASGTTYDVISNLYVAPGARLTLEAGVILRFMIHVEFIVDGTLEVLGTPTAPVQMISGRASPNKNNWEGLRINASATGNIIDHAVIHHADNALMISGTSDVSITDSEIAHSNRGVYLYQSSPQIVTGNHIHSNSDGFRIALGSSPLIGDSNRITNNIFGFWIMGTGAAIPADNPLPTINGNTITGNQIGVFVTSYFDAENVLVNATGNWWGTVDSLAIASTIVDRADSPAGKPWVDWSGYLDAEGGVPISTAPVIYGTLSQDTVLAAATSYDVLDSVTVPTGVKLTLQQGATLNFLSDAVLHVDGILEILGTSGSPVSLTAPAPGTGKGRWQGIFISASATLATIEHAIIRNATRGVEVFGNSSVSITHSELSDNSVGIYLTDSSPQIIQNNIITANDTGINVRHASSPLIGGGNEIFSNAQYGIYLSGNWTPSTQPAPIINGNSIHSNGWNFYSIGMDDPENTVFDATGNWWGSADYLTVAQGIFEFSDFGGMNSGYVDWLGFLDGPGGQEVFAFFDYEFPAEIFDPWRGEVGQMVFKANTASSLNIKIYPHDDSVPIYETNTMISGHGIETITWDGRDNVGNVVSDGAYRIVPTFTQAANVLSWDPAAVPGAPHSAFITNYFNAYENDYFKTDYYTQFKSKVLVTFQQDGQVTTLYDFAPKPSGTQPIMWDGRDDQGNILSGPVWVGFGVPERLRENAIIVTGSKPSITGLLVAPDIEVKSDPYHITHSYDQFTRIGYRLDQDAMVTFKLLPPGISDPADPSAIVLVNNVLASAEDINGDPADHVVEWRGHDLADTNNIQVSQDGAYTFTIEATSVASGESTLYRGVVQIQQ